MAPPTHQLTGASPPGAAIFVAPHPDDIAIAAGGLAAVLCDLGVATRMVLATDGSEARIPESVLRREGWVPAMSPLATRELRGRIRVAEGREEARCLGVADDAVVVLDNQRWHSEHSTPPDGLFNDLSLRDVAGYKPGPIDQSAVDAMRSAISIDGKDVWVVVPHPDDRLLMHQIVTRIALEALGSTGPCATARVLFYDALSTTCFSTPPGARAVMLAFDEAVMVRKRAAIRAHASMAERRRVFGGYSTTGTLPYDELAHDRDRELAGKLGHTMPFAERFFLVDARDAKAG